jgi:hypothetical protein
MVRNRDGLCISIHPTQPFLPEYSNSRSLPKDIWIKTTTTVTQKAAHEIGITNHLLDIKFLLDASEVDSLLLVGAGPTIYRHPSLLPSLSAPPLLHYVIIISKSTTHFTSFNPTISTLPLAFDIIDDQFLITHAIPDAHHGDFAELLVLWERSATL